MQSFEHSNKTTIIFGTDAESKTAREIAPFSKRVLVVCSRGASNKTGIVDRVEAYLKEAGISFLNSPASSPIQRYRRCMKVLTS